MKEHPVYFQQQGRDVLKDLLAKNLHSKYIILCDENTYIHCVPEILRVFDSFHFEIIVIPSGEQNKSLESCGVVWNRLTELNADRKSLLINIGGGVLTDLGGFVASCYKRGIDFIHIPTTLLSMVDASTGGKTGVDFGSFKNQIGTFSNPLFTWVNPIFLNTLDSRQIRSGSCEMIKHGLIKEKNHFFEVIQHMDSLGTFIESSIKIKQEVVKEDPKEEGVRKILNFGHTLGHALESYYLGSSKELLHGEAIAAGMIMEGYLSSIKCGLSLNEMKIIQEALLTYFPYQSIKSEDVENIISLTLQDKKNMRNKVLFVGLSTIGSATYDIELTHDDAKEAIAYYRNLR